MFYLYGIYNTLSGKLYIGATENPSKRWKRHQSTAASNNKKRMYAVHFALLKYGVDSFTFKTIDSFGTWKEA